MYLVPNTFKQGSLKVLNNSNKRTVIQIKIFSQIKYRKKGQI